MLQLQSDSAHDSLIKTPCCPANHSPSAAEERSDDGTASEAPLAGGHMAWLGGIGLGCESPAMGSDLPHVAQGSRIIARRSPYGMSCGSSINSEPRSSARRNVKSASSTYT